MAAEFPIEYLSPNDLLDHPLNWGAHSEKQKTALAASMGEFGWLKPLLVNKRTGRLIDGHARAAHARALGVESVPCRVVDVDEETERRMLLTVDRVGEMRTRNDDALMALLKKEIGPKKKPVPGWDALDLTAVQATLAAKQPKEFPDILEHEYSPAIPPADGAYDSPDPSLEPDAPSSFPEFDEGIETDYCCPQCSYCWSGKPK